MTTEYKKYTEYTNDNDDQFIITPTYEYFENNTIEEIELIIEQYPNIFDYEYILDQFAVEDSIQGFNTFNEALEVLSKLDPKNWEQAQRKGHNMKTFNTKNTFFEDKETTLINRRDDLIFELAKVVCELDNIEVDFSNMEQSQMFIDVTDFVTDYLEEIEKEFGV